MSHEKGELYYLFSKKMDRGDKDTQREEYHRNEH